MRVRRIGSLVAAGGLLALGGADIVWINAELVPRARAANATVSPKPTLASASVAPAANDGAAPPASTDAPKRQLEAPATPAVSAAAEPRQAPQLNEKSLVHIFRWLGITVAAAFGRGSV